MSTNRKYYEVLGRLNGVTPEGYEERQEFMKVIMKIRRLAKKHHRLSEFECNGEGYVNGKWYRLDGSVKGAYVSEDVSVFNDASDKVEVKIKALSESVGLTADFQGDPRGNTVKITKGDKWVDLCND